jgi:Tfp pilus assembly protein PilV
MKRLLKNEHGYTLVETLIALTILVAVLIPLGQFIARVMYNDHSRDLIIAQQLAAQEIEKAIALNDFQNNKIILEINNKKWRVVKSATTINRLVELDVSVFKNGKQKSLAQLRTLRFVDVEQ